ncbi:MAG: hypothetical protein COA79_10860 [Planctomycetota bacterium]|nr:MAG: hypothetical protein COA79_10860 [Planctomycetota bacterium]
MNYHLFNFWPIVLDTTDIILIWFILYQVSFLFSNTRSKKIIVGSAIIGSMYIFSIALQLEGISEVFKAINLVQIGSIVLVIIFSQEIKDALTTIGIKRVQYIDEDLKTIEAINQASLRLSSNNVGALILIARGDNLNDIAKGAIPIKADVTSQILESIFFEPSLKAKGGNPLHDGAVIISNNKVVAAKVICKQLSESIELSHQGKGTRHAAGLGFSEQRDCVAIIISHESGEISLAVHHEKTIWDVQSADLLQELKSALGMNVQKSDIWQDINRWILNRKIAKTVSLILAVAIWCISNSVLTITSNVPSPRIYNVGHQWKEGDYVLELGRNEKAQQNIKIEIKNWQRIVYLLRPNEGGLRALQDALVVNTSEETIKKSFESSQKKIPLKLVINKRFKNEIKLIQTEEYNSHINFNIKNLVKKELKDFIKFEIKGHEEVEKVTARTASSIYVPADFKIKKVINISLLEKNNFIQKIDSEIWNELRNTKVFKKDYPNFAGTLKFSEFSTLKSLEKYNSKIEVKFGLSLFHKNQDVQPSEDEIALKKSLVAVIEKYKKLPDKLIDLAKDVKPDRSQVITANNQMKKAIDDFNEIKTQGVTYKKLFFSKNEIIKSNKIAKEKLIKKNTISQAEQITLKELEEKAIQIPREQTICSKISEIYSKNLSDYETQSKQSQEIYKKYAKAYEPVLKIYAEAKNVLEEAKGIKKITLTPEKFDNIKNKIKSVKMSDISKTETIQNFFKLSTESLETFLISKFLANTPGSLHFLKLERRKLYEKLDVHLDQINKHLDPSSKPPQWPDLHKVQTFKYVENIDLQYKQIKIIGDKIDVEEKFQNKRKKYQNDLLNELKNKITALKKNAPKTKVIWKKNNLNNLEQSILKLKDKINKNSSTYEKNKNGKKPKTKVFKLAIASVDNEVAKLFLKELAELPKIYKDYILDDGPRQRRNGFFLTNQMFNTVNGDWDVMQDFIEKTESENTTKLNQYLKLLVDLEKTINVYQK